MGKSMRATIKSRITIPVLVNLVVEWNKSARQCVIVETKIDPQSLITPRMIYEALRPGDFNQLDQDSIREITNIFDDICSVYQNKHPDQLPSTEVRGLPVHPESWSRWMRDMYGAYLQFPVPMAMEIFKGLERDILIEPVLSNAQHAYIWNARPERDALDTVSERAKRSMSRLQVDRLPEGCLQMRKQEKRCP